MPAPRRSDSVRIGLGFLIFVLVVHGNVFASAKSLLTLPERTFYKVVAIPGKVVKAVFPRTTNLVRNSAKTTTNLASRTAKGALNVSKEVVVGTGKVIQGTANTVGRAAGTVGGAVIRSASGR